MSSRIEYRGEAASLLSRGAATVCSPGRKPGESVVFEVKPRRGERSDERSEWKPDRAQPVRDERSECKPDRAQPVRDEQSECKPDAKRKRDSAQPQERAQPVRVGNLSHLRCSRSKGPKSPGLRPGPGHWPSLAA